MAYVKPVQNRIGQAQHIRPLAEEDGFMAVIGHFVIQNFGQFLQLG